ncbi:MAG TPA: hypothetical protein VMU32_09975 [Solirubrobacteraceae bacterium]|nr:hypothetical protein [Solirubrobacteraceae bacterium]
MSPHTPRNRHTTRTRDAALRRLSQANRWLLAGSAALTAAFTAAAATAFPGRRTTTRSAHGTRIRAADPRTRTGTTSTQLHAPAQAPRASVQTGTGETTESAPAETTESVPAESTESAPAESAPVEESAPVVSGGS